MEEQPAQETPTQKQRRVWDRYATDYDRQITFLERLALSGCREWVGGRSRGRILDVAIGTGRSLPHYPGGVSVTGVDLSPQMLDVARRRADELGLTVDLREADAERLPFADGSFDTVVCALALCNIPDPARAVSEMRRVLAPSGTLLLLDHVGSAWPPIYATQWLVERLTIRTAGEHFTRRSVPLLEAAGFTVAERVRRKAGIIELLRAVASA
jgi:ubiquinone/menaquinone biosynthesis C-methylase UbiE